MKIRTGIKHHNAEHGCQKCKTVGEFSREGRKMSFPRINAERRTDHSFRHRENPEHHREVSILEEIPLDMINDFCTSDSLHLLHLGIMKKCIFRWKDGLDKFQFKWTDQDISKINSSLTNCNSYMPSDMHRSVRNLNCINFWKGTEFRVMLDYLGIVVFKSTLREQEYNHFLKLFCAVILCSNDKFSKYLDIAKILFDQYIEEYIDLYGISTISSNVHNLSHIVDDVKHFGNLTKIDAYMFENALYQLKLKLRTCNRPLEQIAKRIAELNLDFRSPMKFDDNNLLLDPELKYEISNGNNESNDLAYQHISLSTNSFLNSRKFGDKWFLANDNQVFEFHFATKVNGKYFLNGSRIKNTINFFSKPFSSNIISIFSAKNDKFPARYIEIERVNAKMLCLPHGDEFVFIPVLHTL